MIKALLPALVLMLLAFAGLGISLLFRRFHFYKHSSIESNPHMKKLGISCVKNDEIECFTSDSGCIGCSCAAKPRQ